MLENTVDQETVFSVIPYFKGGGSYEYKNVKLSANDIVVDAGANAGMFSALASVKGCKVYAFEAIPAIVDNFLSKTAELNPHISICKYALSDKSGKVSFSIGDSFGNASMILKHENSQQIKVDAIDLDSFVEQNNLPSVNFIEADIEGAERYMLMGAKKVLKEFAPKLSICSYHLPDDSRVLRDLVLDANPDYVIEERFNKIYAYVPKSL